MARRTVAGGGKRRDWKAAEHAEYAAYDPYHADREPSRIEVLHAAEVLMRAGYNAEAMVVIAAVLEMNAADFLGGRDG
jgi:hypothetical protein